MGLVSFPLLTGGKGIHVVAPLVPAAEWREVKDFAHRFATALASADPGRFTASMAKAGRKGRIFIDWLRNQRGATAVMPYSVRAREAAPVAAPITWEELRGAKTLPRWHIGDAATLIARAASPDLVNWGRADQMLPDL
jgi:bifunctional non-homologous end joining protein LigD